MNLKKKESERYWGLITKVVLHCMCSDTIVYVILSLRKVTHRVSHMQINNYISILQAFILNSWVYILVLVKCAVQN